MDITLENLAGHVVGVEVKAAPTVSTRDFRGLRALAEATGDRFRRGIVLYIGRTAIPFGKDLLPYP